MLATTAANNDMAPPDGHMQYDTKWSTMVSVRLRSSDLAEFRKCSKFTITNQIFTFGDTLPRPPDGRKYPPTDRTKCPVLAPRAQESVNQPIKRLVYSCTSQTMPPCV